MISCASASCTQPEGRIKSAQVPLLPQFSQESRGGPFAVYTVSAAARWERTATGLQWEQCTPPGAAFSSLPAIVPQGGYVVSGGYAAPLSVRVLIGSNHWCVFSAFGRYYSRINGVQELGRPISPSKVCHGAVCQYFDKGRLEERGPGAYAYGALVSDLLAARALIGSAARTRR